MLNHPYCGESKSLWSLSNRAVCRADTKSCLTLSVCVCGSARIRTMMVPSLTVHASRGSLLHSGVGRLGLGGHSWLRGS